LAGRSLQEGAEAVATAGEVLKLGYRDPLRLLHGEIARELLVGVDTCNVRHDEFVRKFHEGYFLDTGYLDLTPGAVGSNEIGLPYAEKCYNTDRVQRRGEGLLQTFRRDDGQDTALMLRDGSKVIFWVRGPIWAAYAAGGGPGKFGYPLGEEYDLGLDRAQVFGKALFVWERATNSVKVEPR
jgi:hypothetical protein